MKRMIDEKLLLELIERVKTLEEKVLALETNIEAKIEGTNLIINTEEVE